MLLNAFFSAQIVVIKRNLCFHEGHLCFGVTLWTFFINRNLCQSGAPVSVNVAVFQPSVRLHYSTLCLDVAPSQAMLYLWKKSYALRYKKRIRKNTIETKALCNSILNRYKP